MRLAARQDEMRQSGFLATEENASVSNDCETDLSIVRHRELLKHRKRQVIRRDKPATLCHAALGHALQLPR